MKPPRLPDVNSTHNGRSHTFKLQLRMAQRGNRSAIRQHGGAIPILPRDHLWRRQEQRIQGGAGGIDETKDIGVHIQKSVVLKDHPLRKGRGNLLISAYSMTTY
jgi:hypothetical protein